MIFDLLGLSLLILGFWSPQNSVPERKKWFSRTSKGVCMVVSDPEGAEIWVNGKKTKWVTPALVELPLSEETHLILKKNLFKDHEAWIRSQHELSFYFRALEKFHLRVVRGPSSSEELEGQ